jgi:glycosyltransferase involved in cell wall biosynthesis
LTLDGAPSAAAADSTVPAPAGKELISVIIPVFNEEENVERAYEAVSAELASHDLPFEIIFTDNHSTDATFEKLSLVAMKDPRVRVLRLARNFGFHRSILAGYRCARGDAAIQIDCDLEDPPSAFGEFIRLWRAGHDVVIGVRSRRVEARYMVLLRRTYYRVLQRISDVPHIVDAGDFRLVDRSILDQLRVIDDAQPYVRGLISELARNQVGVSLVRSKRLYGKSKFPLLQLWRLAMDGVFTHSTAPLRLATYVGIMVACVTSLMTGGYIAAHYFAGSAWPAGFATTTVITLFGVSLNALFLGIIGEYIGRIYAQVRKRPPVVIEKSINVDDESRAHIAGERRGR